VRALALLAMLPLAAHAADMSDCHAYANRGSAAALRQLILFPFLADPSVGRFLYRKAYSYCLNADEVPVLAFTAEEQPIVDGLPAPTPRPEPPPASVPATDETAPVVAKGRSGFAAGSDQWKSWCRRHFPRSWDAKTGTVILPTSRKRARTPCPG